ncbi:MAG TPA: glycosyltransferase family 2 protein [Ignavibacteria bacterium]
MSDKVGVIIVSYNQRNFLKLVFETLSDQSFLNLCIYFVDNCSNDGSVEHAKELCTEFKLDARFFELNENTGYTSGNNYGVRVAVTDGCKYCLILNSDTELDRDCIKLLIECLESEPGIAATGPILLLGNKGNRYTTIQEFGANVDFRNYKIKKNYSSELFEQIGKNIPDYLQVNFITGACIMFSSSVYEQIGLFDEKYFAYGEEIDFFKKVNDIGLKVFVTKKAIVWHHHDWSGKNKKGYYIEYYLIQRNKYLYFQKHRLYKYMLQNILKDILMYPIYLRWFIRVCDFKLSLYYLKGTFDGLLNRSGRPVI